MWNVVGHIVQIIYVHLWFCIWIQLHYTVSSFRHTDIVVHHRPTWHLQCIAFMYGTNRFCNTVYKTCTSLNWWFKLKFYISSFLFGSIFTRGQFWPSGIVVAWVCVCVCLSVNHQLVRTVTHQPFKLEPPNGCKRPWLRFLLFFGDDCLWTSRSNWTLMSKFTPFWACPCDMSPPIEVSISKFLPKMHLSTVNVPIDLGLDWPWTSVLFLISNLFILSKFSSHYSFASVFIYLVRPLPVSAAHSTWHRTYTDSFMHADSVAQSTVKQSSFVFWWNHRSSMGRRLGDSHWILQALIGSCQSKKIEQIFLATLVKIPAFFQFFCLKRVKCLTFNI